MKKINILLLISFLYISPKIYAQTDTLATINSLSFQEYLNQVARNNLDYLAEQYNVKIADAEVIAGKVFPDPELTFEGKDEGFNLELGFTLELGKRNARVRVARNEAEMEKLGLEFYFQELRAEAAEVYVDAILQRELLEVKTSSYDYMYQLSVSDSIRYQLGEISENDARQSKLEALTLLNEVYQQEAVYKSALTVLAQYMGRIGSLPEILKGDWFVVGMNYDLNDLIVIGLENRLDLVLAQKNIELAHNLLRLTRAERRMDVGLMVGYEKDWNGFLPKSEMLKAGITIPLQFSNINRGSIKASKFQKEKSLMEQKSMELTVQTEISQAFFFFEAAKKQVRQYQSGLIEDSQKVLDGTVYSYQRGETNIVEVLIAQRTYNEVQEQYLESMKEYASALINLEKSCGVWDIEF